MSAVATSDTFSAHPPLRRSTLHALAVFLLLSFPTLSVCSFAASTKTPLTHQSGIFATVKLGTVPARAELLRVGGTSMGQHLFGIGNGRHILEDALFSGSFVGPVSWTSTTLSNGIQSYTVTGVLIGAVRTVSVSRVSLEALSDLSHNSFDGSISSRTSSSSVPEPSMFVMVGTGLLGLLIKLRIRIS